jgi:3'-phosphoadenosine 5'-phosphosulfate sulfotransferase (PAPS reductase)/FAD synthetase
VKCTVCRGPAVIDLRRHNANFCGEHFLRFCRDQMAKAIDDYDMIPAGARVLVAVSGGKDSLALWDLLVEAGYDADGMVIGLGIGDYCAASTATTSRLRPP